MNKPSVLFDNWIRLVHALAVHFGPSTEIVLHDLSGGDPAHTIIAIENGNVSGRKIGDGPSVIASDVMEEPDSPVSDELAYLTRTRDGKVLRSTSFFIRSDEGRVIGLLAINTDLSLMLAAENALRQFTASSSPEPVPTEITNNVSDLLDTLITQSIRIVGKPPKLMDKSDKVRAIRYLNDSGAFLITKSGPRICQVFGISKYTLYSYLDEAKSSPDAL